VVSFTPLPLSPLGKSPRYGWATEPVWTTWRRENSCPYWDSNSDPSVIHYTDCAIHFRTRKQAQNGSGTNIGTGPEQTRGRETAKDMRSSEGLLSKCREIWRYDTTLRVTLSFPCLSFLSSTPAPQRSTQRHRISKSLYTLTATFITTCTTDDGRSGRNIQ
jgi:hypothetical protein